MMHIPTESKTSCTHPSYNAAMKRDGPTLQHFQTVQLSLIVETCAVNCLRHIQEAPPPFCRRCAECSLPWHLPDWHVWCVLPGKWVPKYTCMAHLTILSIMQEPPVCVLSPQSSFGPPELLHSCMVAIQLPSIQNDPSSKHPQWITQSLHKK